MLAIRRLLCPVEFNDSTPGALRHAVALAKQHDAELMLLHVIDLPYLHLDMLSPGFDVEEYYGRMEERAREHLATALPDDAEHPGRLGFHVARGKPSLRIAELARVANVDLIVMPTRRRSSAEQLLLGATSGRVIRIAPCPVLTVPPDATGEPGCFRKILHPTDFSDLSDCAFALAVDLARQYKAELTVLHVLTLWSPDPYSPEWRFPELPTEQIKTIEATALRALRTRKKRASASSKVQQRTVRGFDPPRDIVDAAEDEGADMIVIATHGRSGVAHFLLGSTTEKVVRYSRCPVLTVRPPQIRYRHDIEISDAP